MLVLLLFLVYNSIPMKYGNYIPDLVVINGDPISVTSQARNPDTDQAQATKSEPAQIIDVKSYAFRADMTAQSLLGEVAIDMFDLLSVNPYNITVPKEKNVHLQEKVPPKFGERDVISEMSNDELLLTVDALVKDFHYQKKGLQARSETVFGHLVSKSLLRIKRGF